MIGFDTLTNKLTAIADGMREKTGLEEGLTLDQMTAMAGGAITDPTDSDYVFEFVLDGGTGAIINANVEYTSQTVKVFNPTPSGPLEEYNFIG